MPNETQAIALLKERLAGFKPVRPNWKKVAEQTTGLSYADITRAADEAITIGFGPLLPSNSVFACSWISFFH